MHNPEFIRLLAAQNVISAEDSERLREKFRKDDFAVLSHLIKNDRAKKGFLCKIWGDSLGIAYVDLDKTILQQRVVQKLPQEFAKRSKILPIYQFGEKITVAMADPMNSMLVRETERLMGMSVSPVFSWPNDIEDAAEIVYQSQNSLIEFLNKITENPIFASTDMVTEEQIRKFAGDQAIIEFTRGLLLLALKERGSDIHVEPTENMVRIRFRIDGVLQERLKVDIKVLPSLVTRLKVMANLDITEKRKPQDGRISLQLPNRAIDLRFSSVPTMYGEKIVLRILGQVATKEIPDLAELYFSQSNTKTLKRIIGSPNGVFLVTGPTGSGKTTTLYAVLKYLNKPGINIMTIEDPVEYRLPGINQIQVNHAIQLDFATALRAFLRQDPDVILVGEVRDLETAKIASQAALTGHLVLTTMHTNNALQAVTRLIEIGVEPFLVAPSIIGVMAQRLVRKICDECKEPYRLTPEQINDLFIWDGKTDVTFYRGKGCAQCGNTGYAGRMAIHEVLVIDDELRSFISRGASILEIQKMARTRGFKSMRYDGMKKVLRGLTTLEEINRVTVIEEI